MNWEQLAGRASRETPTQEKVKGPTYRVQAVIDPHDGHIVIRIPTDWQYREVRMTAEENAAGKAMIPTPFLAVLVELPDGTPISIKNGDKAPVIVESRTSLNFNLFTSYVKPATT